MSGVEDKYAVLYEAAMDPFNNWEAGEKARATGSLSPAERLLLQLLDWALPRPSRRLALLVHLALVHALAAPAAAPFLRLLFTTFFFFLVPAAPLDGLDGGEGGGGGGAGAGAGDGRGEIIAEAMSLAT